LSRRRSERVRETPVEDVVVDASTAVRWFAYEADSAVCARLLQGGWRLIAPDFMPVEAANAWWKKVRCGDISRAAMEDAVNALFQIGIAWVPLKDVLPRAARLSLELRHPVYDCVYLATAQVLGARLAAGHNRLRELARQLDVPVYPATLKGRA
jgi:predicted nucleic acid-binding protein